MYIVARARPWELVDIDGDRYFVRLWNGTHAWLSKEEYFFLLRFSPIFAPKNVTKDEEHLLEKFKKLGLIELGGKTTTAYLIFRTTVGCNLSCRYCYAWANPEKISISARREVVDATIRAFKSAERRLSFVWHGGEPTLFWESLIEPTLKDYQHDKDIIWGIQTNGVRFASESFTERFMKATKHLMDEGRFGIGVSIDGLEEDNFMRVFPDGTPAWPYTVKGIENLVSHGARIGSIVVINRKSQSHMVKIAEFLYGLGIRSIRMNPMYPAGHEEIDQYVPDPDKYIHGLVEVAKWVIKHNKKHPDEKVNVKPISEYLTAMMGATKSVCIQQVCGAGDSIFMILPNGDVTLCDSFEEKYKLGNVLEGWTPNTPKPDFVKEIMFKKHTLFQRYFNGPCADCPYKHFCGGGLCPGMHVATYGEIRLDGLRFCPKELFKFFEDLMRRGRDEDLAMLSPHSYVWFADGGGIL